METKWSGTLIATVWRVHSRSMQILTLSDLRGPTGGGGCKGCWWGFPKVAQIDILVQVGDRYCAISGSYCQY